MIIFINNSASTNQIFFQERVSNGLDLEDFHIKLTIEIINK